MPLQSFAYIYLKENSHSSFSNSVEASEGYDERYKELQQMNVGDRTKSGNIIENGNVLGVFFRKQS